MKRRVAFVEKLERLIHTELTDLAVNTPYLNEDFPNAPAQEPSTSKSNSIYRQKSQVCKCEYTFPLTLIGLKLISTTGGTRHREEFSFNRLSEGPSEGREWRELVRPVIERWGKFMMTAYKRELLDQSA